MITDDDNIKIIGLDLIIIENEFFDIKIHNDNPQSSEYGDDYDSKTSPMTMEEEKEDDEND